jgi:hypothetical protein
VAFGFVGFVVGGVVFGAGVEVLGDVLDVGTLEDVVGTGVDVVTDVVAAAFPTATGVLPPEQAASAIVATSVDIPTSIFFTAAFPCQSSSTFCELRRPSSRKSWRHKVTISRSSSTCP